MYAWIWRHLPGGLVGRLLGSMVLIAAAVLLLFTVVFPALEPHVPWSDVTLDDAAPAQGGPALTGASR